MSGDDYRGLRGGQVFGPGSVVVVGPGGRIAIAHNKEGEAMITFEGCNFIGAMGMTKAHRALVDEVWREWDDLGQKRVDP